MPPAPTTIADGTAAIRLRAHGLEGLIITIVTQPDGAKLSELRLPYPLAGYGGHDLVVSPSERLLAVFLYSGQGEVGYELLDLVGGLSHLGGLPYVFGEGDAPVFSPDESLLVMVRETYFGWWDDARDDTAALVPWGALTVHDLLAGRLDEIELHARVPTSWQPENASWTAPTELAFVGPRELRLRTPWGSTPRFVLPRVLAPVVVE